MTGPVVCARHDCGRDWREHSTGGLPATGCRGFLWVDPAGRGSGYRGRPGDALPGAALPR